MERHVLVLFPHPDDETLAVGGTIAFHAKAGSPVTYACFTLGQMGRNMGKPFFANRESLPTIREQELREACNALGITDLRMLGFRDKTLEFEDPELLIRIITDLIKELNPSLVITYYPGYCVHPDHEAVARATVEAIRRLQPADRPKLYCQAFSRDHFEALGERDIIVDTRGVWEERYLAIKAHKSQTALRVAEIEAGLKGDPEERDRVIEGLSQEGLYSYRFES
ncbi:bacillithiol biosynthesis deacetylase BshB2 [Alicyclobacillus mengziensis]|uniref:Bacillithiol biosynthesis deacetylase BshB2 n=1 Tax=Alicyclobacillus mengziensis TaxID=2931921 RepID=A0A9X7Z7X5_9BACL|nr:bacillithiol biosynthesis deacetylase BshB2 [Alicyclobacillus mengziensis]QSO48947.1 bacillithiol biosynthesis deacetylase BshB2 [Alicyclobacillus mengziensis]